MIKKINHFFNTAHLFKVYLAFVLILFIATFLIFAGMDKLLLVENDVIDVKMISIMSGAMSMMFGLMMVSASSMIRKSDESRKITNEFKKRAKDVKNKKETESLWEEVKDFWKVNKNGHPSAINEIKNILDTSHRHFKSMEEPKMEKVDMTLSVENLKKSEKSILDLLKNPWSDETMKASLNIKLDNVRLKIEELESE